MNDSAYLEYIGDKGVKTVADAETFLKNVAINPHLTEAKRDAELVNVLDIYPHLLGIGLDEKAALVVTGDRFEVIGEGKHRIGLGEP